MPSIAHYPQPDKKAAGNPDLLPAAHVMFTAAYMQDMLKDLGTINEESEERVFKAAQQISNMYRDLYSSQDRSYHVLAHARIQLLGDAAHQQLMEIYHKKTPDFRKAVKETIASEAFQRGDIPQDLRNQDRHDCLYYFGGSNSEQHNLLAHYQPPATLGDILKSSAPLRFSRLLAFTELSVGELAAMCAFPDGSGGYAHKVFEKSSKGINELASAVFAINEENRIRSEHHLPLLSAEETLSACVTLAATIPFEGKAHLDDIAANLYAFLKKSPMQRAFGITDDQALRVFVDTMVSKAGHLASRDVGSFAAASDEFFQGNLDFEAEHGNRLLPATDPVETFKCAGRALESLLSHEQRLEINSQAQGNGFIFEQARNHALFPEFHARLSGIRELAIADVEPLYERYFKNAKTVIPEHRKNIVLAAMQLASALAGESPAVAERGEVTDDMVKEFFKQRRPSAAEIAARLVDGAEGIDSLMTPDKRPLVNHFLERMAAIHPPAQERS